VGFADTVEGDAAITLAASIAERAIAELLPAAAVELEVRRGDPCRELIEAARDLDLFLLTIVRRAVGACQTISPFPQDNDTFPRFARARPVT